MDDTKNSPPLRLVEPDSPEELARRFEREKRAALLEQEDKLGLSLAGFRVLT